MPKLVEKRTVDMQIIGDWVEPRTRVLDLGCGRGTLLGYLAQTKEVAGIGVDLDFHRITACVQRGVTAYQGDMLAFMREFPDRFFDRVICSRTVQELDDPTAVILEALRVGRTLTVGFVNHGFWKNRLATLFRGRKLRNQVYTTEWFESRPANPVTIADFEHFCAAKGIRIARRAHLAGNWRSPRRLCPNLLAGYALYDLTR
ncbi:MAG TPA: methionine biosynthesis protein MetW [Opitutaceae bacterium]|nr:methionine biosynthesis protein MetW [Opitutaceae bacterium]HRJ48241.1 methionine biosynthesis protein MetW [Opitutaceae bacterium]